MRNLTGQTITQLIHSVVEKDVENSYRQFLSTRISDMVFTSPFKCDGYGVSQKHGIRLLCEFKKDVDLKNKSDQVDVIIQTIFYVKKFEQNGMILPNVLLLGDKNEWFVLHTNSIFDYLSFDLDWESAASKAHMIFPLKEKLMQDEKIAPFIFSINELDIVVEKIIDLAKNVTRLIPITPHNITEVFSYFENNVLGKHSLNTNQLANLFVQLLINPDENYLHPVSKRKTIVTKSFNEVNVKSREVFTSFFSHFSPTYTPKQKEQLTAVVDRLVQDVTRRKQGEFFTPTIWVDKAHEYIVSVFGEDWKEKYVVWDPAWGTGNLTRDYKFKELYVSTLNYSDIQTAEQMGYNPEAVKFQFDFLNDDYELLPKGLRDAIESGREIIVLMNPPYGANGNKISKISENKKGIGKTKINNLMLTEGWGKSSINLYSQFFYRLVKINEKNKNLKLAVFCPPLYLTGESFENFRQKFFKSYGYQKGFLFQASNFTDVSADWGITFNIFSEKNNVQNKFIHDVLIFDKQKFTINKIDEKFLYNTDGTNELSNWIKNIGKIEDFPKMSSPLNIKESNLGSGKPKNSIGVLASEGNNIMGNNQGVYVMSSCIARNIGKYFINKENLLKSSSLFTSRKLMIGQYANWINQKDEYLQPNEEHPKYNQFTYDSVIILLFHIHSFQSSLRQITYKEKLWDIKNEFFWMSKERMLELANDNHYTELYNDARTSNNRYVYELLFGEQDIYNKLSPDAKLVLDKATELVEKSMRQRHLIADDTNHLNSWDAGYAQLKLVWKEYFPDEFKDFRQLYKNLEDRMRPLVYELGFLLK
jgi:hypothetical protein